MACVVEVVLRAGPAAARRSAHLFDARTEPRNLSRRSVAMKNAFLRAALQLGLRRLERRFCGLLVAGGDGRFSLLDEGANAADPRTVADRAASVAPDALLGGLMVRHFH